MDLSHDHTVSGAQIPFLGSESSLLPFQPLEVHVLLIFVFSVPYKFSDLRTYNTTILTLELKFRLRALISYFHFFDPQKNIFSCSI
jgi:hypothetical protein